MSLQGIETDDEFNAILSAESAIVFVYVPWSGPARISQRVVEEWITTHPPSSPVYRVDPDDKSFVQEWMKREDPRNEWRFGGWGEVLWLKTGHIVAIVNKPFDAGISRLRWQDAEFARFPEVSEPAQQSLSDDTCGLADFRDRLAAAYRTARDALFAERHPDGYWVGELSASALSTATAVSALSLAADQAQLAEHGLRWLAEHQNADGGWGDTVKSFSNISTTVLCRAAIHLAGRAEQYRDHLKRAEAWLGERYGSTPGQLAEAVRQRYGTDHTFSVPILMNAALAGLVPWAEVPALPFEAACVPQSLYRFVGMPVVSYALPALIAIGQTIFHHKPPRSWFRRRLRRWAVGPSLRVLERIQPASGGFLEATPLTSFVVMALAACGLARTKPQAAAVIRRGVEFLRASVRPDGSWPIDSNLSVWVTTLAVNALAAAGDLDLLSDRDKLLAWILEQQETERHPYTGAAPGGWGWSHLSGSVPDADDTPGAMLALVNLGIDATGTPAQIWRRVYGPGSGANWLQRLQNRDGGWPTFCRGWGKLPFDRSGTDLTAHVLRAWKQWYCHYVGEEYWKVFPKLAARVNYQFARRWHLVPPFGHFPPALAYLARTQRPDGSWLPLWFGNQHAPDDVNPTYGTAKVLAAYRDLNLADAEPARRGVAWLLDNQNDDGGWGAGRGTPSSLEETALAVEILLDLAPPEAKPVVNRGLGWLVERVEVGGLHDPTPIGFYFAKLWYFEKLYPIVFAVAALGRALKDRDPAPSACR
jgi:squalene-hopene/tetraprenyl-beta-curcumene cyclase